MDGYGAVIDMLDSPSGLMGHGGQEAWLASTKCRGSIEIWGIDQVAALPARTVGRTAHGDGGSAGVCWESPPGWPASTCRRGTRHDSPDPAPRHCRLRPPLLQGRLERARPVDARHIALEHWMDETGATTEPFLHSRATVGSGAAYQGKAPKGFAYLDEADFAILDEGLGMAVDQCYADMP